MKSIYLFSSYFENQKLPYYVEVYLLELRKHFSELVFISNDKPLSPESLSFLSENKMQYFPVKNEGFDFGMWSKAFANYPIENYERIALVNDSCVLFAPLQNFFNWANQSNLDYCAISESQAISYHLQSYFLVLNNKAALLAKQYFNQIGILPDIKQVIEKYEVGLSTFMLSKGMKLGAFVSNNGYAGEYSPYYHLLESHLQQGVPMMKKKIVYASYRKDELFTLLRMNFKIEPEYYFNLIQSQQKQALLIDFNQLNMDMPRALSKFQIKIYNLKRKAFHSLKKLLGK